MSGGATAAAAALPGSWDAGEETFLASATAKRQATASRFISASERLGFTGKFSSAGADEDDASGGRKRRRSCAGEESNGYWRTVQRGGGLARVGDEPDVGSTGLSEKLVFPFSKYFVVGAPSIVAPELARAWREETVLDFRRSDVSRLLAVGVHLRREVLWWVSHARLVTVMHGEFCLFTHDLLRQLRSTLCVEDIDVFDVLRIHMHIDLLDVLPFFKCALWWFLLRDNCSIANIIANCRHQLHSLSRQYTSVVNYLSIYVTCLYLSRHTQCCFLFSGDSGIFCGRLHVSNATP